MFGLLLTNLTAVLLWSFLISENPMFIPSFRNYLISFPSHLIFQAILSMGSHGVLFSSTFIAPFNCYFCHLLYPIIYSSRTRVMTPSASFPYHTRCMSMLSFHFQDAGFHAVFSNLDPNTALSPEKY